jgi:hypothetical protein
MHSLGGSGEKEILVSGSSIRSGAKVTFRLSEVICPEIAQVLKQVTPELRVCGRVSYFSDCGQSRDHFAIVDVNGVASPLIVPVSSLEGAAETREQREAAR